MRASSAKISPLSTRLLAVCELEDDDLAWISEIEARSIELSSGVAALEAGAALRRCGVVVEGWAVKSKMLSDGRRQIIDFLLPGSLVGMEAGIFRLADHTVETITTARIAWFEPARLTRALGERPHLVAAMLWAIYRDHAVVAERLLSVGQRSAYERLGHLLIELCYRLDARGLVSGSTYSLPINQNLLADALGLSVVHVSRTLSKLRDDGLIDLTRNQLDIIDLEQLEETCEFTDIYLHNEPLPDKGRSTFGRNSR